MRDRLEQPDAPRDVVIDGMHDRTRAKDELRERGDLAPVHAIAEDDEARHDTGVMLGQPAREDEILERGHGVLFKHELRTRQNLPQMSRHHPRLGMMRLRRRAPAGEDDEIEILAFDQRSNGFDVLAQPVIQVVTADDSYRAHLTFPSCGMYAKDGDSLKAGYDCTGPTSTVGTIEPASTA